MPTSAAPTHPSPVQIKLADGSLFACRCKSTEFRVLADPDAPVHYFCRCGQVYVPTDLEGLL